MNAARPRTALAAVLAVAALCAGLTACDKRAPADSAPKITFRGADITGATYARTLSLPDIDGKPRTLADFKGKVTAVFFGYTQCPDACPTTMAELAQVRKALGADGDKLQGVFVSLDPERDTPEILKSYMASFDPSFIALRGTPEQARAAADGFRIFYAKVPGKVEGSYTLDHTAGTFVIDSQGNVRLFERYGAGVEAMSADIKALISAPA